jgi:predicted nucleic acid-binding protein
MRETQHLANNSQSTVEKRVFDVNILAIFLAEGHPGFTYVAPVVEAGLRGAYAPLIMDILPLRAFWIMTRRWGLDDKECSTAIQHFIESYNMPKYPPLRKETISEGFRLAEELKHDVFDCIYVAFALQEKAESIVTTDTDFKKICNQKGLRYINPVPEEILKRFKEQNK